MQNEDLVVVKNLTKHFPVRPGFLGRSSSFVHAVDDVSLSIKRGQTLGLVGESGCGKTTIGRLVLRLLPKTSGSISFEGKDIFAFGRQEEKAFRRDAQLIFQDAFSSFDIRNTVGAIVGEPLKVHHAVPDSEIEDRVAELLRTVKL